MTMHEEISRCWPVRKTKAQKAAFRSWVLEKAKTLGYAAQVEETKLLCRNHNIVIGDPEQAEVIVTAHYDTPAVMPIPNFITPRNIPMYLLYQLLLLALLFVPSYAAGAAATAMGADFSTSYWIGLAVYMALLVLMMAGPANRHNANDNTSGVAAVLQLMEELPENQRGKAAFILFDNEELGMLGSSAYVGRHRKIRKEKLLINLDCVGVGEDILFFTPKKTRALPAYGPLRDIMQAQENKQVHFFPAEKSMYPSDQAQFAHGIAVCACKRHRVVGYYCSRIHTAKDTVCDQQCLDVLTYGLTKLITTL